MKKSLISRDNSLIIKGVGILLMLFHHLFYSQETIGLYNDVIIHGFPLVNQLGIFCKLCVAVFVFVSGYGLAVSTPKGIGLKGFFLHRFKKLYLNYWIIWLVFVPIGVFVFHRTFSDAYGSSIAIKAILEFFGLLTLFGGYGYNPTWWFYSCIIILYLLFPLLNNKFLQHFFLIISAALVLPAVGFLPVINVVSAYLLPFVFGMLLAKLPIVFFERLKIWEIITALLFLSVCRFPQTGLRFIIDALLCVGFALFLYKVELWKWLKVFMMELGRHSMNIFLFHTFIYYYWFKDFIYASHNPIVIFIELLIVCYLLSMFLEWFKRKSGYYKFF